MAGSSEQIRVAFDGPVAIVTMERGRNEIHEHFVRQFNQALDTVLGKESAKVLVATGTGKFFCNGFDLAWAADQDRKGRRGMADFFNTYWYPLLTRLLTFPLPTIAALNGHVFGGGCFLSLTFDLRVMNSERGWWCMNEVLLGLALSQYACQLVRDKLQNPTAHEAAVLGTRYTGKQAKENGIVHMITKGDTVLPSAISWAKQLVANGGYDKDTLQNIKYKANTKVLEASTSRAVKVVATSEPKL